MAQQLRILLLFLVRMVILLLGDWFSSQHPLDFLTVNDILGCLLAPESSRHTGGTQTCMPAMHPYM